MQNNFEKW